jgi:hypothetical protein
VAANDVWSVGYEYPTATTTRARIQHWNGSAWSLVPSPNGPAGGGILYAVEAVAANDVWAVGSDAQQIITLHWNGSQWSLVPTPPLVANTSYLLGVSAVAANDVWAVGYYSSGLPCTTLTMHWNGSAWSIVPSPSPDSHTNLLTGVSAVAANEVWAVGWQYGTGPRSEGLILHWDGNTWNVALMPLYTMLYAVDAVAANAVWAVAPTHPPSIR